MSSASCQVFICFVFVQIYPSNGEQVVWDSKATADLWGNARRHSRVSLTKSVEPISARNRYNIDRYNIYLDGARQFKHLTGSTRAYRKGANTVITAGVKPYRLHSKSQKGFDTSYSKRQLVSSPAIDHSTCGFTIVKHNTQAGPNFRVVGGENAQPQAWPWMAAVGHFRKGTQQVDFHCGGTLISDNHVLTAAHCILFPLIKVKLVRLGAVNLGDTQSALDVRVKRTVAHFGFDWISGVNDIGVLFLARKISFTDSVRPICLPGNYFQGGYNENYPFVAGWGLTKEMKLSSWLQEVSLPLVPFEECKRIYAQLPPDRALNIQKGQICGGYEDGGRDACQGDSGGPLMMSSHEGLFYLIGIISLGDGCGQPGIPGIFTDVTYYMSWLERVLNVTTA